MAKIPKPEAPYLDSTVYGPYWHKQEGRRIVFVLWKGKPRTSTSYARYLMSVKLGRILEPSEQVDHINNDKTDDRIENLQILNHAENVEKSAKGRAMVNLQCPQCGVGFTRERRQTHLVKGGRPTCCSKSCGGKHSHLK